MIKIETEKCNVQNNNFGENICNLGYLSETMAGEKHLIKEIIDIFLKQFPEELQCINDAIKKTDYALIKSIAHTMKSSVLIIGISSVVPVLQEIEDLGRTAVNIEKIKELNQKLNVICMQAISEIEREKYKYI